jgi:hypothetical protein
LKRVFGFGKVRYRGLKNNHEWLCAAFAAVNLYRHRKRLAPLGASGDERDKRQRSFSRRKLTQRQEIIRS